MAVHVRTMAARSPARVDGARDAIAASGLLPRQSPTDSTDAFCALWGYLHSQRLSYEPGGPVQRGLCGGVNSSRAVELTWRKAVLWPEIDGALLLAVLFEQLRAVVRPDGA